MEDALTAVRSVSYKSQKQKLNYTHTMLSLAIASEVLSMSAEPIAQDCYIAVPQRRTDYAVFLCLTLLTLHIGSVHFLDQSFAETKD